MDFPDDIMLYVTSQYTIQSFLFILDYYKILNHIGPKNLCRIACQIGHLKLLIFARTIDLAEIPRFKQLGLGPGPCPLKRSACHLAARHGHLHILVWLKNQIRDGFKTTSKADDKYLFNQTTYAAAAQNGHLHIIKWLRRFKTVLFKAGNGTQYKYNKCDWNASICSSAAQYGHLHIIKWVEKVNYSYIPRLFRPSLYCKAVKYGHLNIIQWYIYSSHGALRSRNAIFDMTVHYDKVDIADWLSSQFEIKFLRYYTKPMVV